MRTAVKVLKPSNPLLPYRAFFMWDLDDILKLKLIYILGEARLSNFLQCVILESVETGLEVHALTG